ncbi:polyprenyl synthetase family protein [Plectonema radiosum NIES-515]|uniref:Polyprenyl synthetase family protein n=1 Tax=Plectonema radiosum NIES-515 TaxID=2986073 RepID=A0ABT3AUW3_9CYAN|nr:polyprenyl synthetase family protein [Plectonema radiosum]MCV3212379.1 polyprenyl synthetase family protein [Plectonema radiosum NIES-515]
MLEIYLLIVCLSICLFGLLIYNQKHNIASESNNHFQKEAINITTLLPRGQQDKNSTLTQEINLNNGTQNESNKYQQFYSVASHSDFQPNSTTISRNGSDQNSLISSSTSIQITDSVSLSSENKSGVALLDSIATTLLSSEDTQNSPIDLSSNNTAPELMYDQEIINEVLQESRLKIVNKIKEFVETRSQMLGAYQPLYDLLVDYPFRNGKMLRPTLCISVARAVGGMGHNAVTSASALELYHNAFLIHDDIEDGSEARRGQKTLHSMIGIPRAINVGDATNVLAVGLLLENLSLLGVDKALSILHEIEFMAQQSVEGQAMELDWVANNASNLTDQDYFQMCVKKTCWYSFMTPCRIGLIVGHPSVSSRDIAEPLADITRFGMVLGIAFQIQDDLLNLQGSIETYGKEIGGDIYEGKRTLMLNHVLSNSGIYSQRIIDILALPREKKTPEQVNFILEQMIRCGSIKHGWEVARLLAGKAEKMLDSLDFLHQETPLRLEEKWECSLHDRRVIKEIVNYIIYRNQ